MAREVITGWGMITEYFYILIMSIEFVGDEHVSPELKVPWCISVHGAFRRAGVYVTRDACPREMHARQMHIYKRCTNFISSDKILYYQEQIVVVVIFIALILA